MTMTTEQIKKTEGLAKVFCKNPQEPTTEEKQAIINFLNEMYVQDFADDFLDDFNGVSSNESNEMPATTTTTERLGLHKAVEVSQETNEIIKNVYNNKVCEDVIGLVTGDWEACWKKFRQEVENQIINSSFSSEKKAKGLNLLRSVDSNIPEVLCDFFMLSVIMMNNTVEEVESDKVQKMLSKMKFKNQHNIYGSEEFAVKLYNEKQQLNLDPFVSDDVMLAEFIGTTRDDFFLTVVMYEDEPQKLYFEIEIH